MSKSETPNPDPENKPVPDTAITDKALAEHIAYAVKPHVEFNQYANEHGIGVLPMYTEQTLGRMAAAEAQAVEDYKPIAEAAQAKVEQETAVAANREEEPELDLLSKYPVVATVFDGAGRPVFPTNRQGKESQQSPSGRAISSRLADVTKEVDKLDRGKVLQVVTLAEVDQQRSMIAYHTPGYRTKEYASKPRVSIGVVVPANEVDVVFARVQQEPEALASAVVGLRDMNAGGPDAFDQVPPFDQWNELGVRRAGDKPESITMVPIQRQTPPAA